MGRAKRLAMFYGMHVRDFSNKDPSKDFSRLIELWEDLLFKHKEVI